MHYLIDFAFYYPLFMAYLWMMGGIYFYLHWEKHEKDHNSPPALADYPPVSVVIPCYNEGAHVIETIESMLDLAYPNYDIIAVNDGSKDDTGTKLNMLAAKYDKVKVVHLASNQGKATGLCTAAMLSQNEFLMCIDGDAILDKHCITWMMRHFIDGPRIGAVTGNPRIRNRSSLLGKLQVGEFSSIIGLIKRAQRVYGRIFTVSGVVAMFRKSALHQSGYWSTNMITEDIDISWKLQTNHWAILFEPNALCWILMPETLKGLFKQRIRWAQGGAEVLLKYFDIFQLWRKRRMWIVYFELITSIFWAYIMTGIILLWAIGLVFPLPPELYVKTLLPGWNGVVLGFTCLLQFGISLFIDSRYERAIKRYYYWMIWYPMLFWLISAITAVIGLPKAIIRNKQKKAVWTSLTAGYNHSIKPMIIENPKLQSKTLRTIWLAVTMFMWLVYVYLWLPLISLLAWWFGYKTFEYHMVTLNGFFGLRNVFLGYFFVILLLGTLLILWAKLEKYRFSQKTRRSGINAVNNHAVAQHFNVDAILLDAMQTEKIVTVSFNQKGEVADIKGSEKARLPIAVNHI